MWELMTRAALIPLDPLASLRRRRRLEPDYTCHSPNADVFHYENWSEEFRTDGGGADFSIFLGNVGAQESAKTASDGATRSGASSSSHQGRNPGADYGKRGSRAVDPCVRFPALRPIPPRPSQTC